MIKYNNFKQLGSGRMGWRLTLFVAAFAGIGIITVILTRAATPTANLEPELGNVVSPATVVASATASGGSAVKFQAPPASGGKPSAGNTGHTTPKADLTVVNGNMTITTNGTVVDGRYIKGFLIIRASNVTIRNTLVEGGVASGNGAIIDIQSGTNILLDHVTVTVANPSVYLDGIWGDNLTGQYLDVSGSVDGMKLGSNSTIKNSYIHNMRFFSNDPNQGGGSTHNDAIQILEGTNILLEGNNMVMVASDNASVQITQDFGTVSNVTIQSNWMDGGGCTVNIAHKSQPLNNVFVYNNRFGRNTGFSGCALLVSTQVNITQSGNVYDDNNQPISMQRHD